MTSSCSSVAEWVSSAATPKGTAAAMLPTTGAAGEEGHGGADALAARRHEVTGSRLEGGLGVGGGPGELHLQRAELVEEAGNLRERGLGLLRPDAAPGGIQELLANDVVVAHRRRDIARRRRPGQRMHPTVDPGLALA